MKQKKICIIIFSYKCLYSYIFINIYIFLFFIPYTIESGCSEELPFYDKIYNYCVNYCSYRNLLTKLNSEFLFNYIKDIYSCLLVFPSNNEDYIITSSFANRNNNINKVAIKIYSLNNSFFIRHFDNIFYKNIFYLLSWNNKINNKNYIICFSTNYIIIKNLFEDEIYSRIYNLSPGNGYIFIKDNNDYLCYNDKYSGSFFIYDLNNNCLLKTIKINIKYNSFNFINWNEKYNIIYDKYNYFLGIIDLNNKRLISNIEKVNIDVVKCIKKIYHPVYGEIIIICNISKTVEILGI